MSSGEADGAYASKQSWCTHSNTVDWFDNPSRFRCVDCGRKYIDYGHGWVEDLVQESVPQLEEINDYWYTRYQKAAEYLQKMIEHDSDLQNDAGAEGWPCELSEEIRVFLKE